MNILYIYIYTPGRKGDTAMLVSGSIAECMAVGFMKSMRKPFMYVQTWLQRLNLIIISDICNVLRKKISKLEIHSWKQKNQIGQGFHLFKTARRFTFVI